MRFVTKESDSFFLWIFNQFRPFFQIILQEIDDANQQVTDERSLTVFIRRWNPSTMTLGSFNEVTIYGELRSIHTNNYIV